MLWADTGSCFDIYNAFCQDQRQNREGSLQFSILGFQVFRREFQCTLLLPSLVMLKLFRVVVRWTTVWNGWGKGVGCFGGLFNSDAIDYRIANIGQFGANASHHALFALHWRLTIRFLDVSPVAELIAQLCQSSHFCIKDAKVSEVCSLVMSQYIEVRCRHSLSMSSKKYRFRNIPW